METIKKIIIEAGGKEYQLAAGEGGITPGVPIPQDTVDSQSIVDGAVEMEDLNKDVKDKLVHSYDSDSEGIRLGGIMGD